MIGLLVDFLAPTVGEKWAKPVAWALIAAVVLALMWGGKCAYDHNVIAKHEQKIERRAAPATNKAADERATDTITNAKAEEEMHNVIASQPDQPIAPTSHARACEQLRRAGHHSAACNGPAGGR